MDRPDPEDGGPPAWQETTLEVPSLGWYCDVDWDEQDQVFNATCIPPSWINGLPTKLPEIHQPLPSGIYFRTTKAGGRVTIAINTLSDDWDQHTVWGVTGHVGGIQTAFTKKKK